jgi:hypothetical protein
MNKSYGRWTVIHKDTTKKRAHYICRCKCGTIRSLLEWNLKLGNTKSCGCLKKELRGDRSPNWKGTGQDTSPGGYIRLRNAEYPGAIFPNRTYEHTAIMARYLGRPLLPHENVHHKNGVRSDNKIENLELWSTHQPIGHRVIDVLTEAVSTIQNYAGLLSLEQRSALNEAMRQTPVLLVTPDKSVFE